MIKVRVVRGIQASLPLASGFIALGVGMTACANTADSAETTSVDESQFTVANPGTGVFELGWAHGTPTGFGFVAKGTTDEYVRVQQTMTFAIPAHFIWAQLHSSQSIPSDLARLKKLSAKITVSYLKNGASYTGTSVAANGWEGDQAGTLNATSESFVVDRKAQAMRFSLELTDSGNGGSTIVKMLDENSFFTQAVIGGTLPEKTLLFDSNGSKLRSRVLEGGRPVQDAELSIAFTDWRASTVVNASKVDREIGTTESFGRFGASEIPVYGELDQEISYVVSIDGVAQAEAPLVANGRSRLLPANRIAYEGSVTIPAGAQSF